MRGTSIIVNAAGAWGDEVARLAGLGGVGLVPMRRTAALVDPPPGAGIHTWPFVIDAAETVYFKPDAGLLLASPADETPLPPHDVQPEELDVAIGIDRLQALAEIPVRSIRRSWAGLRSFVADRNPVVGFDPGSPRFFWFVGQGGYGIQLAPSLAETAAALLLGVALPDTVSAAGIDPSCLSPARACLKADGTGQVCP